MAIIPKGQEPANVKKRIDTLFPKLDEAYPDKVIVGLQRDHKKWDETAREISKQLGYANKNDFLTAYGYRIEKLEGGRPSGDHMAIIDELKKRYPNGAPFAKIDELKAANLDLAPKFKALSNNANELFSMPLGKYLLSIGLIQSKVAPKLEKKKNYIVCKILPTGVKNPIYYIATSKSIHVGDIVEVPVGIHNCLAYASVQEVINCDEDSVPCDIDEIKTINRKIGVREYTAGLLASVLRANAAINTDRLINNESVNTFSTTNTLSAKLEGNIMWACCRGLATDVISVLDYLVEKDNQVYEYNDLILIDDGISELYIFGDDVLDIIAKYPDVKMVMFLENAQSGRVDLCYSKSGYSTVTDTYMIGVCDTNSKSRWTLKNSPTEDFKEGNIEYTFKFNDDWEGLNYVFTDETGTRKQLGK